MPLSARQIDLDLLGVIRGAIALVIDPSKTQSVYDVEDGLRHRRATALAVEFVQGHPDVVEIFAERYLAPPPDLDQLAQLPAGSLGKAYATYLQDSGFEADFYRALEGVLKVLAGHILRQAPDHDADHGDVDQGL